MGLTYLPLSRVEVEAVDESGDCAIEQLCIKSMEDGTPKWDADNSAGNDSGPSNKIVRSFDYISYTLEYLTKLKNKGKTIKETDATVELTLNADPAEAKFDTSSLGWMTNRKTKYYYSDNTSGDTWDQKKTVVKQVVTGTRLLKNTKENTAVPGVGKLTLKVAVQGAKNNQVLKPEYRMWIGGAQGEAKQAISEGVKVSAKPMLNLKLLNNTACTYTKGYLHSDGTFGFAKKDASDKFGRMKAFVVEMEMLNPDKDKGRKGFEVPTGNISFDVQIKEKHNGTDKTSQESFKPVFYEWSHNNINNHSGTGKNIIINGNQYTSGMPSLPQGYAGARRGFCDVYNGGNYVIADKGNGVLGITIKDWSLDKEQYHFPNSHIHGRSWLNTFTPDRSIFTVGQIMFLCQYPETMPTTDNLELEVTTSNFKANTLTNQNVADTKTDDNAFTENVNLKPVDGCSTRNIWGQASDYGKGDASGVIGQTLGSSFYMSSTNWLDDPLQSFDFLQKFDDKLIQPVDDDKTKLDVTDLSPAKKATTKILYGAKPDKSGWEDDAEQQKYTIENLIFFDSLATLRSKGYTCVAVLGEARNGYFWNGDCPNTMYVNFKVTDDASKAGQVAMTTMSYRGWKDPNVKSKTAQPYSGVSGAYGLGSTTFDWTSEKYDTFQPKPCAWRNPTYAKSTYDANFVRTGGHTGYERGQSLLITGSNPIVSVKTDKGTYDLDNGQREAVYTITPGRVTESTMVMATLPKDLTYINDGANINPSSIETKDGVTVVKWTVTDNKPITFKALIGHAGTKDDIPNGGSVELEVRIRGARDTREYNDLGNVKSVQTTKFTVVNLATMSVSDSSEKLSHTVGDPIKFDMNIGNKGDDALKNMRLINNLPANGDSAGSSINGGYSNIYITANYKDASSTFNAVKGTAKLYASMDSPLKNDILKSKNTSGLIEIKGEVDETTKTIKYPIPDGTKGIYYGLNGDLRSHEYIKLHLEFVPGDGQKASDRYAHEFSEYADNQLAIIDSNSTSVRIVGYKISGRIWNDKDLNGLSVVGATAPEPKEDKEADEPKAQADEDDKKGEDGEPIIEYEPTYKGRPVSLYEKIPESKEEEPRATTTTNEDGYYEFTGLVPGKYTVIIPNAHIYKYGPANIGEDDEIDNDAEYNEELDMLIIGDIEIEDHETNYETDEFDIAYNDFGVQDILKDPIKMIKIWKNDSEEIRPKDIDITIKDNEAEAETQEFKIDKDMGWVYVVDNLRQYRNDGSEAEYEFTEGQIDGYEGKMAITDNEIDIENTCKERERLVTGVRLKNFSFILAGALGVFAVEEAIRRSRKSKDDNDTFTFK